MKKVTKKNKTTRSPQKRKRSVIISSKTLLFSLIAIGFALFYFYSAFNISDINRFSFQNYSPKFKVTKEMQKKINKEAVATSTKSPSPTSVPLAGFCLNTPVLMYHHIQPEENAKQLGQTALTVDSAIFDSQMAYLSQNGYTTYYANDFINALITHQQLAPKSVVITIDDGYEDNYIYALPVLQKYGLKANIMLATGLMGNSNMLSWNEVRSLKDSGLIYFTDHTWSHFAVNRGSQEKIEYEINTAQKQIQDNTGELTNVFTYPYGAFSDIAITTLQKLGYTGAFSEIPGQTQCDSFLMTLHRTRIGNGPLSSYGL